MKASKQRLIVWFTMLVIVLIDQAVKFYVKLHFTLGEAVSVFPWFQICFVENPGMAFGIEWFDKLFLTLFRIILVAVIGVFIHRLLRRDGVRTGYLITLALIIAGAVGNIIDCLFYGLLFSASTPMSVATLLPASGGYAGLFYGKVVDMLYFPLIHNAAGETLFFRPIFNIADSAITVAVFMLLIFYRKDMEVSLEKKHKDEKPHAARH